MPPFRYSITMYANHVPRHIVNGDDIRMIEPARGFRLAKSAILPPPPGVLVRAEGMALIATMRLIAVSRPGNDAHGARLISFEL